MKCLNCEFYNLFDFCSDSEGKTTSTTSKKTTIISKTKTYTTTTTTTTKKSSQPTSTNGRCGKDYGQCPTNECCSKYGYCDPLTIASFPRDVNPNLVNVILLVRQPLPKLLKKLLRKLLPPPKKLRPPINLFFQPLPTVNVVVKMVNIHRVNVVVSPLTIAPLPRDDNPSLVNVPMTLKVDVVRVMVNVHRGSAAVNMVTVVTVNSIVVLVANRNLENVITGF